jgi:hypothetical protein
MYKKSILFPHTIIIYLQFTLNSCIYYLHQNLPKPSTYHLQSTSPTSNPSLAPSLPPKFRVFKRTSEFFVSTY